MYEEKYGCCYSVTSCLGKNKAGKGKKNVDDLF